MVEKPALFVFRFEDLVVGLSINLERVASRVSELLGRRITPTSLDELYREICSRMPAELESVMEEVLVEEEERELARAKMEGAVVQSLLKLRSRGVGLVFTTALSEKCVSEFLRRQGLGFVYDGIYDRKRGLDEKSRVERVLKDYGVEGNRVVYVGRNVSVSELGCLTLEPEEFLGPYSREAEYY